MSDAAQIPQSDSTDQRLTRLEEHAAFAERTVEELAEEVRLLNARIREMAKRLAAAEARVGKVEARESSEPPPADAAK